MKPVIQRIIVAGIVEYKRKVLIIQRSADEDVFPNLWEIPSGKREQFEKSKDALVREVKEEVGLDIEIISPVDVFEFKVEKENEIKDSTQISFLCKLVGKPEIKLSNEHQNFAWISENEIDNFEISDDTKRVLRSAFDLIV
jgi:8-oxo-dGTP pyrophosphatase MutT (NUDIX family)